MIKNNKKKIAVGVAIVAAIVAWSLFKPAPAEAAEINAYGSLNYRMGNDEDVNGKSVLKAEDNGSSIGVDISEELVDGISGFAKIELGVTQTTQDLILSIQNLHMQVLIWEL